MEASVYIDDSTRSGYDPPRAMRRHRHPGDELHIDRVQFHKTSTSTSKPKRHRRSGSIPRRVLMLALCVMTIMAPIEGAEGGSGRRQGWSYPLLGDPTPSSASTKPKTEPKPGNVQVLITPGDGEVLVNAPFGFMDDAALLAIVNDTSEDDPDALEDAKDDDGRDDDGKSLRVASLGLGQSASAIGGDKGTVLSPDEALAVMKAALEAEYVDGEDAIGGLEYVDDEAYFDRAPVTDTKAALAPSSAKTGPSIRVEDESMKPLVDYVAKHASGARAASAHGGFPVLVPGSTKDVRAQETKREGWVLSWSDEFNGDTLDLKKWRPKTNASAPGLERYGGQQQWYTPDMCKVVDGALVLATRRRDGDIALANKYGVNRANGEGYPFLSCWVDTKETFMQTYGRVEIRAKIPDSSCPGIWPQHWMLPNPETTIPKQACWPLGGQIDIMQSYGKGRGGPGTRSGTVESGYHFAPQGECGVDGNSRSSYPAPMEDKVDFSTGFHTFAVEWNKESLTFFVDGHVVNVLSQFHVPIIPRWPFYLILNTAVSPFGMPDALDQCADDMFHYIDYVRVYKRSAVRLSADVWHFLAFSAIVLVSFILLSVCALRGAYKREEELFHTSYDEHGLEYRKPIKRFSYDVNDEDESASFGREKPSPVISAATPLVGDIVLALPDDGTGRYQPTGRFGMSTIRRRPLPPSQGNRGYYADIWSRDAEERHDSKDRRRAAKERERRLQ